MQGQGAGTDTTWGQDTTQEPGRNGNGDQDTEEKGTTTAPEDTRPRHRPPGRATPRTVTRPHHGL